MFHWHTRYCKGVADFLPLNKTLNRWLSTARLIHSVGTKTCRCGCPNLRTECGFKPSIDHRNVGLLDLETPRSPKTFHDFPTLACVCLLEKRRVLVHAAHPDFVLRLSRQAIHLICSHLPKYHLYQMQHHSTGK